ncbi:hypothetical protein ACFQH3_12315 [Haladaptatus sp. GCM10025707]|uniref:DUF7504 family protein n=1 Tax=Haladaptatus sp. GCM10025707 TaxID=3252658 RepID=UPI0036090037
MSSSDRQLQAVVSRPTTYALGSAIDIEGFEEVPPGTNLLIEGPLQADTRQLATQLLATGTAQGENAVVISSDANADRVVRDVSAFDGDADRLYVVDCTGVSGKGSFDDEPHVKYVTSPSDLTGIGVGLVKCTQEIGAGATSGLRLGVFSSRRYFATPRSAACSTSSTSSPGGCPPRATLASTPSTRRPTTTRT